MLLKCTRTKLYLNFIHKINVCVHILYLYVCIYACVTVFDECASAKSLDNMPQAVCNQTVGEWVEKIWKAVENTLR